jgi:hypothetical protein
VRRLGLATACLLAACGEPGGGAQASDPEAWFADATASSGVAFTHVAGAERRWWFPEIMGSGLGLADVDADGALDLYAVQSGDLAAPGSPAGENRLFRNRGDGRFEDVTARSGAGDRGYGMGCAFGDADGDGRVDLYVTNLGPNALYRNLGSCRFEEATARAGTGDPRWGTSAAFFDPDADGDLDLFVVNYVNWARARELECTSPDGRRDYCSPKNYNAPAVDVLYQNDGDGTFRDVSAASGIARAFGNGLGLAVADFDLDGNLDVYVANDQMPNQLWLGRGDLTFADEALLRGCAVDANGRSEASMGAVAFDHGDDGDADVFLTHLDGETNTFYENRGGEFADRTDALALGNPSLASTGFGVGAHDFDQDGRLDLFVANGRVTRATGRDGPAAFAQPNQLYRGRADGRFEELPGALLGAPGPPGASRGAAFGDWDGDGDVDLALLDNGGALQLLVNRAGARGHWLGLSILERRGLPALGARVRLAWGAEVRWRTVQSAYGYLSSSEPRVHLGLGAHAGTVDARVTWVDGEERDFGALAVDRLHVLERPLP